MPGRAFRTTRSNGSILPELVAEFDDPSGD
jgi:hypothetical protein